jgi:hypothetical protein
MEARHGIGTFFIAHVNITGRKTRARAVERASAARIKVARALARLLHLPPARS